MRVEVSMGYQSIKIMMMKIKRAAIDICINLLSVYTCIYHLQSTSPSASPSNVQEVQKF